MSSLNELGIIPECDIARADERARQRAEIESLKAKRDALRADAEPERNFCERCGKRLSLDGIHTCTPPSLPKQEGQQ